MKHTLITLLFFCNACIGQDNSIKLGGFDYEKANSFLQIQDDTGTVFYYTTEDSTLFISDSLRTIKWLIQLVIEDMKTHYPPKPELQEETSLYYIHTSSFDSVMWDGGGGTNAEDYFEPVRKLDTIMVEAFVTDTFYRPHAPSYSLKLYSVTETQSDYLIRSYYLDSEKKELSKNIIVWQTK